MSWEDKRNGQGSDDRGASDRNANARDAGQRDDDFAPDELSMLRDFFRDEAQEALDRMTGQLLGAGAEPPTSHAITELMRTTHTLKGSAGTVGLNAVVHFTHELEERFARLRDGRLHWSAAVLDRFIETVDALRSYIDAIDTPTSRDMLAEGVEQHLTGLRSLEASRPRATTARPATEPPGGAGDISDGTVTAPLLQEDTTRSIVANPTSDEPRRDGRGVLRVDPGRVDLLMDSVGELVFDRTRIERRVQAMRGLVQDIDRLARSLRGQARRLRDQPPERNSAGDHRKNDRVDNLAVASSLAAIGAELGEYVDQMHQTTTDLLADTDALRRTSNSLQNGLTRVRMSSARSLFQTLSRQLRSMARSAGKKAHLVTSGDDTEFDKTVAERIADPLVQLLRNAVAHGIETEDERMRAGKPGQGEVRIDARQEGSLVVIEVSDDGAGIDPDALRDRFVSAGWWSRARADLASDEDVLHAIFDAGVSTRDQADQLAGRGVGLDTVRETIARLGGEIRMTSTPGKGTRFTMRLPVSTAVSHALLFKVHRDVYALPYVHVVETAHVNRAGHALPADIEIRGQSTPLVDLQAVLQTRAPRQHAPSLPAIIMEYAGRRVAMTCDKIVGPREIVVKELGPLLAPLPLYAGATISGSGKVQLILDPAALTRLAYPDAQPPAAPIKPLPPSPDDTQSLVLSRALVVDDSVAIREAMTRILESAGYVVDSAGNGATAWSMVSQMHYDLVVTDLEMPELDGFGLIERIRHDSRLADMPVIVVSSCREADHLARMRKLAVKRFVQKPVNPRDLQDALKSL